VGAVGAEHAAHYAAAAAASDAPPGTDATPAAPHGDPSSPTGGAAAVPPSREPGAGLGPAPMAASAAKPAPASAKRAPPPKQAAAPPPRQHRSTTALDDLAARFARFGSDAGSLSGLSDGGAHPASEPAPLQPLLLCDPRGAPSPGGAAQPGSTFDAALGVLPPLPLPMPQQLQQPGGGFDFALLAAALSAPPGAHGAGAPTHLPEDSAPPAGGGARHHRAGGAEASPAAGSRGGAPLGARRPVLLSPQRSPALDPFCKPNNHLYKARRRSWERAAEAWPAASDRPGIPT
jgi:hypothetical protein